MTTSSVPTEYDKMLIQFDLECEKYVEKTDFKVTIFEALLANK